LEKKKINSLSLIDLDSLDEPSSATALSKLSSPEKMQLLQWLDLERNSDILKKTDQKMSEKLRSKLSKPSESEDLKDDFEYDDIEELSDDEIEGLLKELGKRNFEDNDDDEVDSLPFPVIKDDDFDYNDELDISDLLDEYKDDNIQRPLAVPGISILPPEPHPKTLLQPPPPSYIPAATVSSYETPSPVAYSQIQTVCLFHKKHDTMSICLPDALPMSIRQLRRFAYCHC